jgi:hypothetical protein
MIEERDISSIPSAKGLKGPLSMKNIDNLNIIFN